MGQALVFGLIGSSALVIGGAIGVITTILSMKATESTRFSALSRFLP